MKWNRTGFRVLAPAALALVSQAAAADLLLTLGEHLEPLQIVGMVLILGAIGLPQLFTPRDKRQPEATAVEEPVAA